MKLQSGRNIHIVGHRGAAQYYPENTMQSFRAAFSEYMADMIEFDLQLTRDAIPVILHDKTLTRTTNGRGKLSQLLFRDLKDYDAGYHFNPQHQSSPPFRGSGLTIPSFEELVKQLPHRTLFIELKESSLQLIEQVMKIIRQNKAETRVIMTSKYHLVFKTMIRLYPDITRALSHAELLRAYKAYKLKDRSYELPPGKTILSMPRRAYGLSFEDPKWIRFAKNLGAEAYFWTINDPHIARRLVNDGADGLITDDPGLIHQALLHPA